MEHPIGININFILNASEDASDKNLLMDVPEKHTGYTHIALEIIDLGEVERHLTAAGIPITETVTQPDGTVFFFVRDPDGNVIEFHKPNSPNAEGVPNLEAILSKIAGGNDELDQ